MDYDAIIVGGGSAGALAGRALALKGYKALILDARLRGKAGASWVNGVSKWAFDFAGLERPHGNELVGRDGGFQMAASWGDSRVYAKDTGLLEVDMRQFISRIHEEFLALGGDFLDESRVLSMGPAWVQLTNERFTAPLVVDASGVKGLYEPLKSTLLCRASQGIYEVSEPEKARTWLAREGLLEGDSLSFSAVSGPYSIANIRVEGQKAFILTGSLPEKGNLSAHALRKELIRRLGFIGRELRLGQGAIPLDFPPLRLYERDGKGAVLRFGDSARMIYSIHGSGIGLQMMAARLLERSLPNAHALTAVERQRAIFGALPIFQGHWNRRALPVIMMAFGAQRLVRRTRPEWLHQALRYKLMPASALKLALRGGF